MKTTVEWLEHMLLIVLNEEEFKKIKFSINQAKEMEKQQIIYADLNGSIRTAESADFRVSFLRIKELGEQYYKETFKK
jgi:hypothetical protein